MNKGHLWFESVLISITFVMGLGTLLTSQTPSSEFGLMAALWLIALGVLQVFHSLFIGLNNWDHKEIRKSISLYWCGVALNFMVMFLNHVSYNLEAIFIGTILVFPLFLAISLWFITYKYQLQEKNNFDQ